jgi:hypothetical protein
MPRIYQETFDRGTGGWWGFAGNHLGLQPLGWRRGAVTSRSPWWIDYNHAPPGAGYLHMLCCLNVRGPFSDHHREVAGENAFAAGAYPLDFREAQVRLRLRGEIRCCCRAAAGRRFPDGCSPDSPFPSRGSGRSRPSP